MYQKGTTKWTKLNNNPSREVGLREQGTPDGIRFSISLITEKNKPQTTKTKWTKLNNNPSREVGLREQGTPDGIRFSISLIEKRTNHKPINRKQR